MQIPTLVKSGLQRMLNMTVMQLPGPVDHLAIFVDLCRSQRRATFAETVRRNRHNVCRAVGQPDAGAGERNMMQVSFAGTGIWLSDGGTNIMPVAPYRF